jgi:hypothetical protein
MAIDNMKLEPQREITESVLGIGAAVVFGIIVYSISRYLKVHDVMGAKDLPMTVIMLSTIIGVVLTFLVGVFLIFFTHFIGEEICAGLKSMGWDPRPKQRYEYRTVYGEKGKPIRTRVKREK